MKEERIWRSVEINSQSFCTRALEFYISYLAPSLDKEGELICPYTRVLLTWHWIKASDKNAIISNYFQAAGFFSQVYWKMSKVLWLFSEGSINPLHLQPRHHAVFKEIILKSSDAKKISSVAVKKTWTISAFWLIIHSVSATYFCCWARVPLCLCILYFDLARSNPIYKYIV